MDNSELTLVAKLAESHADVQRLWQKHQQYEEELRKLEKQTYKSEEEERKVRELKKTKLEGKTKLLELVEQYSK